VTHRVLVTGGAGLLGTNCALQLRDECSIILGLNNRQIRIDGVECHKIALGSRSVLAKDLWKLRPDLVIHAAGITDVDRCEREPGIAFDVNVSGSVNVARACRSIKVPLVHVSTDHLFNGNKAFVRETQTPAPLNIYGKTKAHAEEAIMDANPSALIVRTNFFGWGPVYRRSFSDFIIDNLSSGSRIKLFEDVFFTPVLIETLVNMIFYLVDRQASGVFNISCDERVSKYQFGLLLSNVFGLDANLIETGSLMSSAGTVRPRDMSLSNEKVKRATGILCVGLRQQLHILKNQREDGYADILRNLEMVEDS